MMTNSDLGPSLRKNILKTGPNDVIWTTFEAYSCLGRYNYNIMVRCRDYQKLKAYPFKNCWSELKQDQTGQKSLDSLMGLLSAKDLSRKIQKRVSILNNSKSLHFQSKLYSLNNFNHFDLHHHNLIVENNASCQHLN